MTPNRPTSHERLRVIAAYVVDLRAEFEAQMRSLAHIEERLGKATAGEHGSRERFDDTLRRELAQMLTNNDNIKRVLTEVGRQTPNAAPLV